MVWYVRHDKVEDVVTPSCVVDMLLEVLLIAHVFGRFPSNCCVAAAEPVLIVDIKIASQDNVRARLSRSFNACLYLVEHTDIVVCA